ncbi:hypothetical protein M514_18823 [Trichuris suis]|uniref:Uncharacterized protein n=1 Tax=Trichuris suis TaxID=68888 RepID=A0A085NHS4_9BILA|nr:hypothetical protein M514_18823 [Trichuris suis]
MTDTVNAELRNSSITFGASSARPLPGSSTSFFNAHIWPTKPLKRKIHFRSVWVCSTQSSTRSRSISSSMDARISKTRKHKDYVSSLKKAAAVPVKECHLSLDLMREQVATFSVRLDGTEEKAVAVEKSFRILKLKVLQYTCSKPIKESPSVLEQKNIFTLYTHDRCKSGTKCRYFTTFR